MSVVCINQWGQLEVWESLLENTDKKYWVLTCGGVKVGDLGSDSFETAYLTSITLCTSPEENNREILGEL